MPPPFPWNLKIEGSLLATAQFVDAAAAPLLPEGFEVVSVIPGRIFGLCYDSAQDEIDGPRSFDLIDDFSGRTLAVQLSVCFSGLE